MKKKGLVEQVVLGKAKDKDFTANDLPANRFQLFRFLMKNKLRQLYCNHLLSALFFLPLLAWAVLCISYTDLTFGDGTPLEQLTRLPYYSAVVYGTAIPLWMLAFWGLSGGMYVTRKLCWGEPVVLRKDFKKGMKQSGGQFVFVGFITGILWLIVAFCSKWIALYAMQYGANLLTSVGMGCLVVVALVLTGVTMFALSMASLYNVSLGRLYLNSFKLYFATFVKSSGIVICSVLLPLILIVVPLVLTQLIAYCIIAVVQVGWMMLLFTLCCHSAFDKFINAKDYPDFYGKGLRYGKIDKVETTELPVEQVPQTSQQQDVEEGFEKPSGND